MRGNGADSSLVPAAEGGLQSVLSWAGTSVKQFLSQTLGCSSNATAKSPDAAGAISLSVDATGSGTAPATDIHTTTPKCAEATCAMQPPGPVAAPCQVPARSSAHSGAQGSESSGLKPGTPLLGSPPRPRSAFALSVFRQLSKKGAATDARPPLPSGPKSSRAELKRAHSSLQTLPSLPRRDSIQGGQGQSAASGEPLSALQASASAKLVCTSTEHADCTPALGGGAAPTASRPAGRVQLHLSNNRTYLTGCAQQAQTPLSANETNATAEGLALASTAASRKASATCADTGLAGSLVTLDMGPQAESAMAEAQAAMLNNMAGTDDAAAEGLQEQHCADEAGTAPGEVRSAFAALAARSTSISTGTRRRVGHLQAIHCVHRGHILVPKSLVL